MQYHNANPLRPRSRAAFTLVELLVVIAIIGILIALLLPAVQAAREAARRMQCANHFKQIGLAMHTFHNANRTFPVGTAAWNGNGDCTGPDKNSQWHGFSWGVHILPYIDHQAIYDQFDFNYDAFKLPPFPNRNAVVSQNYIETYLCPSGSPDREFYISGVGGNAHAWGNVAGVADSWNQYCNWTWGRRVDADGVLFNQSNIAIRDISDGTSHTLMVGEVVGGQNSDPVRHIWYAGNTMDTQNGINLYVPMDELEDYTTLGFASYHPGGCNFLLCDGSAHFLSEDIDINVLRSLATREGLSNGEMDSTTKIPDVPIPPDVLN